ASDSEKTDFDEDEKPNLNQNDDEEEEHEEEYVHTFDSIEFTDDDDDDDEDLPVSSDFTNQFLNLDNVPPTDNEVVSMMNVKVRHEEPSTQTPPLLNITIMVIPETSSAAGSTNPLTIPPITPLQQQSTPTTTHALTTATTVTSIPALLDFSSLFGFDQRVSALEKELSQLKQADYSAQLLETIKSYTTEFEKKSKDERKRYIDLVEKSVKVIIKDEVKNQLLKILPKEVFDYATPVIQSSITESLNNIVLAKSSSQPKSTYEVAASLIEFELKKILLDKIQKSKSYRGAQEHKDLYDELFKSYKLNKDLFESYRKVYSLKRDREDKDKDEDPPAGSDQGLKKQKTSKDVEPLRGSKSKESNSSSFKDSKSQSKSSSKSAQAEEPLREIVDTEMPLNQREDLGNIDDQPNFEEASKEVWFKKPERLPTPDSDWNTTKSIDFRPPQTWISKIAKEGHEYPFDLSKPLPLIENQGRQVVPASYFFNNDLEYLKGRSLSRKYTTSITKTKAAKYDIIEGIKDMVPSLWSPVKMFTRRVVILKRVKDLQLGVKSYQKKLNITRPETFRSDITKMTSYTTYNNPQGIIYEDKFKRNRLMHSDELYKFCDGTLTSVRRVLHDIASSLEMDYLPKKRWSKLDRKRYRIMIKEIDQQLFEIRLMRNLEKFVGGIEYGEDFRLLEQTL
ncbi:hypothetical protein Tco_0720516, partial [Tanacetum coccineum]